MLRVAIPRGRKTVGGGWKACALGNPLGQSDRARQGGGLMPLQRSSRADNLGDDFQESNGQGGQLPSVHSSLAIAGIENDIIDVILCLIYSLGNRRMRITISLDDELVSRAQALTGIKEKPALIRKALTALVEHESARRLARLGGSEPDLAPLERRQIGPA